MTAALPGVPPPDAVAAPLVIPEARAEAASARPVQVHLHVDEALGVADVSVDGVVEPHGRARVAAALSCRLHAAIERASTTVVLDLDRAPGCDPADPVIARVLECARAGAASRGLTLDVVRHAA